MAEAAHTAASPPGFGYREPAAIVKDGHISDLVDDLHQSPTPGWGRVLGESGSAGSRELVLSEAPGPRLPPPRSRSAISRFLAGLEAAQMETPKPASRHASAAPGPVAPALALPAPRGSTDGLPALQQRKPWVWWLMPLASSKPPVTQPLPARPPTLSLPGLGDHHVLPSSPIPTARGSPHRAWAGHAPP